MRASERCRNGDRRQSLALGVDPSDGGPEKFVGVYQVKFVLDVGAVSFDGLDAQMQFFGHLPRPISGPDEAKDLQFAVWAGPATSLLTIFAAIPSLTYTSPERTRRMAVTTFSVASCFMM